MWIWTRSITLMRIRILIPDFYLRIRSWFFRDADPGSQNNANPDPQHTLQFYFTHGISLEGMFNTINYRMCTRSAVSGQSPWVGWRPASSSPAWSSPSPQSTLPLRYEIAKIFFWGVGKFSGTVGTLSFCLSGTGTVLVKSLLKLLFWSSGILSRNRNRKK